MKNLEERHVLWDYNRISVLGTKKSGPQMWQPVQKGPAGMRQRSSITAKSSCTLFSLCYFGESKGVRQRRLRQVGNGKSGVALTELGKTGTSNERD